MPKDAGARADGGSARRQQRGGMRVGEAYMLYVVGGWQRVLIAVETAGRAGMGTGQRNMANELSLKQLCMDEGLYLETGEIAVRAGKPRAIEKPEPKRRSPPALMAITPAMARTAMRRCGKLARQSDWRKRCCKP
jgi:hypothetical protein